MSWKLICPSDNWRGSMDIEESALAPISFIAGKLALTCTKDFDNKKIYVDYQSKPNNWPTVKYPKANLPLAEEPKTEANYYYGLNYTIRGPLVEVTDQNRGVNLSDNFTLGEFVCHDSRYSKFVRVHPDLVNILELIRKTTGKPLVITSAYRPASYNQSIGGATYSQHVAGTAADIYCPGLATVELCRIADNIVTKGGVGYYPRQGFVHVDVRGEKARWEE